MKQKEENNKISIIVPVYKVEQYLDRCVNSILNQTYTNFEIILVDDGSPDNSPAMCDEWAKKDERIKVVHKQNGGVSSARNAGLKKATGKYIFFVDSDDEIEPNCLETLLNALFENNAELAYAGSTSIGDKNKTRMLPKKDFVYDLTNKKHVVKLCTQTNYMSPWKLFIKEKITDMFDESLNYGEDLIFNLNYFKNISKVAVVKKSVYLYYQYENSLSHNKNNDLYKKSTQITDAKYDLFLQISNDEKTARFCAPLQLVSYIQSVIRKFVYSHSKYALKNFFNEVCKDKEVKRCINLFHPKTFKTWLQKFCIKNNWLWPLTFLIKFNKFIKTIKRKIKK